MAANYVDALPRLMFPAWSTACFVKDPTHASMWGIYGDGHKGACLEFTASEDDEGRARLPLTMPKRTHAGLGLLRGGFISEPRFTAVRYANDYPRTDFFQNLGRLTRSKLKDFWYRDLDHTKSPRIAAMLREDEEWKRSYWARHDHTVATKLPHWAHEQAHRLVLGADFGGNDVADRKYRYRFCDLTGLTFGIKTINADKIAMLLILAKKVQDEGHPGLTISQASFSQGSGRIEILPLPELTDALRAAATGTSPAEHAAS